MRISDWSSDGCSSDLTAFTRFLEDGRVCLSNNAAERALRGIALGRKSWLFCGSDRGGQRAAVMYSLIATARLNDVDPQAWLEIGRASCRERVCKYVKISVGAV